MASQRTSPYSLTSANRYDTCRPRLAVGPAVESNLHVGTECPDRSAHDLTRLRGRVAVARHRRVDGVEVGAAARLLADVVPMSTILPGLSYGTCNTFSVCR